MTETAAARDRCDRKMADLRKHVPFIEATIRHLRGANEKSRPAQLSKLESLRAMLTDVNRKWKYPVLLRCEELIVKLKTRTEPDVYADRSVSTEGGGDAKKSPEEIPGSKTRPIPSLGSKSLEDATRDGPKRLATSAGNGSDKNVQSHAKIGPVKSLAKDSGLLATTVTKKTPLPDRGNPESSTTTTSTGSKGISAKENLQKHPKIGPVKSFGKDSGLLATTDTNKTHVPSRGNPESSTMTTSAVSGGIPVKENLQNQAKIGPAESDRSNPEVSGKIIPVVTSHRKATYRSSRMPVVWRQCISEVDHVTIKCETIAAFPEDHQDRTVLGNPRGHDSKLAGVMFPEDDEIWTKGGRLQSSERTVLAGSRRAFSEISPPGAFPIDLRSLKVEFPGDGEDSTKRGRLRDSVRTALAGSPRTLPEISPPGAFPIDLKSLKVEFPGDGEDSTKRGHLQGSERTALSRSPRAVSLSPPSEPPPKDSKSVNVVLPEDGENSTKLRRLQGSERKVLAGSPRALSQTSPRAAFPINSKSFNVVFPGDDGDLTKLRRSQDSERTAPADLTQEAWPNSSAMPFPNQFKSRNTVFSEDGENLTKRDRLQDSERKIHAESPREVSPISPAVPFPKDFNLLNPIPCEDDDDSTKRGNFEGHKVLSRLEILGEGSKRLSAGSATMAELLNEEGRLKGFEKAAPVESAWKYWKSFRAILAEGGENLTKPASAKDCRKIASEAKKYERSRQKTTVAMATIDVSRRKAAVAMVTIGDQGPASIVTTEMIDDEEKSTVTMGSNGGQGQKSIVTMEMNDAQAQKSTVTIDTNDGQGRKCMVTMGSNDGQGQKSMVTMETNDAQGQKSTVTMDTNDSQGQKSTVTMDNNDSQGQKSTVTMDTNDSQRRSSMVTMETNDAQGQTSMVTMETNDAQGQTSMVTMETNDGQGQKKCMVTMETNDGYEQRGYSSTPLHVRNIKTASLATLEIGESSSGTSKIGFQHKQAVGVVKRENADLIPSTRYGEGSRTCTSVEILDFIVKNYKQIKRIFDSDDSEDGGGESRPGRRRRKRKKKKKHKRRYSSSESSDDSEHRKRKKSAKQEIGVGEKSAKTENDVANIGKTEAPDESTSSSLRRSDRTEMETSSVKLTVASLKKREKKPDGTAQIQDHREIDAKGGVSTRMALRSNASYVTSDQTQLRPSNGSNKDGEGTGRRTRSQSRLVVQRDREEEDTKSNSASARDKQEDCGRKKSREPVSPSLEENLSTRPKSNVGDERKAAVRGHVTSDSAAVQSNNSSDDEVEGKGRMTRSKSRRDQGQEEAIRGEHPRSNSASLQDDKGRTSRQGRTLPVSPFPEGNLINHPKSSAKAVNDDKEVAGRSSRKSRETSDAEDGRTLPVSPFREGHLSKSPRSSADGQVVGRSTRKSRETFDAEEGRTLPVSPSRKRNPSKRSRSSVKFVNDGQEVAAGEADRHFDEISIEMNECKLADMKPPDRINAELGEIRTPPTGSPRKRRKKDGEIVLLQEKRSNPAPSPVVRATRGHHRDGYYDVIVKGTPCELCPYDGPDISFHYKTVHPESEVLTSKLSPRAAEMAISRSKGGVYEDAPLPSRRGRFHQYACPFCDTIVWEVAAKFYDHLAEHTGEFKYACGSCGYASEKLSEMDRHQDETHDGVRKLRLRAPLSNSDVVFGYLCSICNYVQTAEEDLTRHVQLYHKKKGAEIFKINLNFIGLREEGEGERAEPACDAGTKMIEKSKRGGTAKGEGGSNSTAVSELEGVMGGNDEVDKDKEGAGMEEGRNPEETRGPISERMIEIAPLRIDGGGAQSQSPPSLSNADQSPHLPTPSNENLFDKDKSPLPPNGRVLTALEREDIAHKSPPSNENLSPAPSGRGLTVSKSKKLADEPPSNNVNFFAEEPANECPPSNERIFAEGQSALSTNDGDLTPLEREDLTYESPSSNEDLFAEGQFPSGRSIKDVDQPPPSSREEHLSDEDESTNEKSYFVIQSSSSSPSNELDSANENQSPPFSSNNDDFGETEVGVIFRVGLVELLRCHSGRISYGCLVPGCSFCSDDEHVFGGHCQKKHARIASTDWLCDKCGINFPKITLYELFLHVSRVHSPRSSKMSRPAQEPNSDVFRRCVSSKAHHQVAPASGELMERWSVKRSHLPTEEPPSPPKFQFVISDVRSLAGQTGNSDCLSPTAPSTVEVGDVQANCRAKFDEVEADPSRSSAPIFVITDVRSLARKSANFDCLSPITPSTANVDDVQTSLSGKCAEMDDVVASPSFSNAPPFVITDVRSLAGQSGNPAYLSPTAPSTGKIDDVQTNLTGKHAKFADIVTSPSFSNALPFVITDVRSLAGQLGNPDHLSPTALSTVEVGDVSADESRREGSKSPDVLAGPSGSSALPFVITEVRSLAGESDNFDCLSPTAATNVTADVRARSRRKSSKFDAVIASPGRISAPSFVIADVRSLATNSDNFDCLSPTAPSMVKRDDAQPGAKRKGAKHNDNVTGPSRGRAPVFVAANTRSLSSKSDTVDCLPSTAPSTVKVNDVQASGSSWKSDVVARSTNARSLLKKSNTNCSPPTAPSTVKLDEVQASGSSPISDLVTSSTNARSLLRKSNTNCSAPSTVKLDELEASGSDRKGDDVAPSTNARSLLKKSNSNSSPPTVPSTVKLDEMEASGSRVKGDVGAGPSRCSAPPFVATNTRSLLTKSDTIDCLSPSAPSTLKLDEVQASGSSRIGNVVAPSINTRSVLRKSNTNCSPPTAPSTTKLDVQAGSTQRADVVAGPSRTSASAFVQTKTESLLRKSNTIDCLSPTAPSTLKHDDVQVSGSSRKADVVAPSTNARSLLRKSSTDCSPPTAPSTVKLDDVQTSGSSRKGHIVTTSINSKSLLSKSDTNCSPPTAPSTVKLDEVHVSGSRGKGDVEAGPSRCSASPFVATNTKSLSTKSDTIDCLSPTAPSTVKLDAVQASGSSRIGAFEFVVFNSSLLTEEADIVADSPEVTMKSKNFDAAVEKWKDATPSTTPANVTTRTSTGSDKSEARKLRSSRRLRRINDPDDDDLELEFDEEAEENPTTAEGQAKAADGVFCKCPVFGCHFSTYDKSELFGHTLRHGNRYIGCLYCDKVPRLWQYTSHIMDKHFFLLMVPMPSRILPRLRSGKYLPLSKLVKPYSWVRDGCTFKTIFGEWIAKYREERGAVSCGYCSAPLDEDVDGHFATHGIHPHHCPYCRFGSSKANRVVRHMADSHEDLPFCLLSRFVTKNLPAHSSEYQQLSFLSDQLIAARTSEMGLDTKRKDPPAKLRLSTAPPAGGNESAGTALRRRRHFRAPPEYKCGEDTTSASETEDVLRELIAADPEDAVGGATGKDFERSKRDDVPAVNDEVVFVDVIADRTTEESDADTGLVAPEEFRVKSTWRRYYKCPICQCAIKEPIKFYDHLVEEGASIRTKYLDGATDEGDRQLRRLIENIIRHQTRIMYYWLDSYDSCRLCSKTFYSSNHHYLTSHELRHLDGAPSFRCPLCQADYFAEGFFFHLHKTHWSNLPAPPPKPTPPILIRSTYKPDDDDLFLLRIVTYADLEGLRRCPIDRSPKTCAICLYEGSYREQVVHYAAEHPGKEVLGFAFRCTVCRKYFDLARLFRLHNRERHASEAKATTTYVGAFREKCTVCGERFDDRTVLRSHFRTHTEPYVCKHCDHRTYNLRSLRKHYCDRHEGESFDFLFDFAAEKVGRTRRIDEAE